MSKIVKSSSISALSIRILMLFLLPLPGLGAVNLADDPSFENVGSFVYTNNLVTFFSSWRYFSLGNSDARLEPTTDAHSGATALHLWRFNASGDVGGVDNDHIGRRMFVEPGKTYRASVWAKTPASGQMRIRIPEFDGAGTYLGVDHGSAFPLTSSWQEYTVDYVSEPGAASAAVAIVLDGPGEVIFDDVSFQWIPTTVPGAPTIALPTGITTDATPRVEWRGEDHDSFQVRIAASSSPDDSIVWDSGQIAGAESFVSGTGSLPEDQTLYVHVREQNLFGWGLWNVRSAPFRVELPPQPTGILYTYDLDYTRSLTPARAFENAHLVSALQGIVNRTDPRLYVHFVQGVISPGDVDQYWLDRLREPGRWLAQKTLQAAPSIESLVQTFAADIQGVVLWDRAVPATSNVASTVAGVGDLLPIPYDTTGGSLYQRLVATGPQLPVVVNLVGKFTGTGVIPDIGRASSGSAKCDAYLWAKTLYIDTGLCDAAFQGYYIDAWWINNPSAGGNWQNHTLTNHDFFIAHRGFIWDLNVWGNEKPVDDPGQPLGTDLATVKEILLASYQALEGKRMIHVGGFTPWAFKYTDYPGAGGSHGGVDTEWEMVRILSSYNAYIDADALGLSALANASVFMNLPLPERYAQPLPPMPDEMRRLGLLDPYGTIQAKTYLYHYIGDYDSAAWVTNTLYPFWDSPDRGQVTLTWAVSPTDAVRARQFFEYAYRTRTARDTFAAGSSGAGYVNPTQLLPPRSPSGLPSAADVFAEHGQKHFRPFDYDFTGFVINGHAGANTSAGQRLYLPFSGGGIVDLRYFPSSPLLQDTMPVFSHAGDLGGSYFGGPDPSVDGTTMANDAHPGTIEFLMYRTVISTPTYYKNVNQWLVENRADRGWVFCDSDLFSYAARQYLRGTNDYLATYLFDTVPDTLERGQSYDVQIAVRNDGWVPWEAAGPNANTLVLEFVDENGALAQQEAIPLPADIEAGDAVVLPYTLSTSVPSGTYFLQYEMVRGSDRFSNYDDMPWSNAIVVEGSLSRTDLWVLY